MVKNGLHIELTEPVVFLRGPATGEDSRGRRTLQRDDIPPALLRGVLTLTLAKPSRIKRIDITLEGKARTEWPEGIGPRRTEIHEEHTIFEATTNFFTAHRNTSSSRTRRATSIGPGIVGDREQDEDDPAGAWRRAHPTNGHGAELDAGADSPRDGQAGGSIAWAADGDPMGGERGRGRDPRAPRSFSVLPPSRSTVHSRRPSFDATDHLNTNGNTNGDVLDRNLSPTYTTRFRFTDPAADRGPSPAYTPHASPSTHTMSLPLDPLSGRSSSASGLPSSSILSPIQSAGPSNAASLANSRDSSRSADANEAVLLGLNASLEQAALAASRSGQRPVRPSIPSHDSDFSTRHSSYMDSSDQSRRSPGSVTPEHQPLFSPSFSAFPPASAVPPSLEPFHRQDTPPSSLRRVSYTQANVASTAPSSTASSPAGRHVTLPPSDSAPSSRRNSRDFSSASASTSTINGNGLVPSSGSSRVNGGSSSPSPHPRPTDDRRPSASGSSAKPESRSRSRFKFSGMGSALRGISQDIKDNFTPSAHSQNRSSSRGGDYFPNSLGASGGADGEFVPHGRGGAGKVPRGRRQSPTRGTGLATANEERSASRSRGRAAGIKKLRGGATGSDDDDDDGLGGGKEDDEAGWKEFRKGVYHYPISFTIPVSTPPTIHADFGSVVYRLKAVVHRAGALSSKFHDEKEVRMVATPGEDDTEETENVVVERQWEDELRYLVALSGKSFPIGGQIPISIRLMPLEKVKIYRISVLLEEKIDYFAHDKKVARHEATRRYQLLALRHSAPGTTHNALLPIDSDASDAISSSPLEALARASAANGMDPDDATSQLLNPTGPWVLEQSLQVPDCSSKITFTTKHSKTNMTVAHWLKVVFRVERGTDDGERDSKGKKKQFDIIIETPIAILDCRCNVQYISLPSYEVLSAGLRQDASIASCTCKTSAEQAQANRPFLPHTQSTVIGAGASTAVNGANGASGSASGGGRGRAGVVGGSPIGGGVSGGGRYLLEEESETVQERSDQFARLVSGQETPTGEVPPSYDDVFTTGSAAPSRTMTYARSASRGPSSTSRSRSRAPNGASNRTASPLPPIGGGGGSRNSSRGGGGLGLF